MSAPTLTYDERGRVVLTAEAALAAWVERWAITIAACEVQA